MAISVLTACPTFYDSSSFYRGAGPLSALHKTYPDKVNITYLPQQSEWHDYTKHDIFFVQRPFHQYHIIPMEMAKSYGLPIWLDFDDDVFNVPESNKANPTYANPHTKHILLQAIGLADVVTVSTEHLKRSLMQRLPVDQHMKIRVINNAWPDLYFGANMRPVNFGRKEFFWRGSQTHDEDIYRHLSSFKILSERYPDWSFTFLGEPLWLIRDVIPERQLKIRHAVHLTAYFSLMRTLTAGVCLVPLHDHTFNKSKSNIAALESVFGGAICVGPAWEEWNNIGAGFYHENMTMADAASAAIENWEAVAALQRENLEEHYLLSRVNEARMLLINQLAGK